MNQLTHFFQISTVKFIWIWLLLFCVLVGIHVPYFLSDNYWLDGDEAIIGIMANEFLKSGKLPFLFYGQSYGFASVEVLSSSLFIAILGKSVLSIKLAGFFVHSLALTFIERSLSYSKLNKASYYLILIAAICFPTFYLWSSQIRTVSFLLASILFFLTYTKPVKMKWLILVFIISLLCFLSQPFMFVFTAPFIAIWLIRKGNGLKGFLLFFIPFIALVISIFYWSKTQISVHEVPMKWGVVQWAQLKQQFSGFLSGFTGFHYFTMDVESPFWWKVLSSISIGLLLCFCCWKLWKNDRLLLMFFMGAFLVFCLLLSGFSWYAPRYWISFFGGSLLLFVYTSSKHKIGQAKWKKLSLAIIPICFVAGLGVSNLFKHHFYPTTQSERVSFWQLNDAVHQSKVKALYTTDVYLQWQWNYLLGDEIPCTSLNESERTNLFLNRVKKAEVKSPNEIGLIGYYGIPAGFESDTNVLKRVVQYGEKYFLVADLKQKEIKAAKTKVNSNK